MHLFQVAPSTLAVHVWPPEPVEGVPEPLAVASTAAMLPEQQFNTPPPGNAMLLSSGRKLDVGRGGTQANINIPNSFLSKGFNPPISSGTQVTAHVVIRTQDVARLPPDAAAAAETAASQNQSANNHYVQLQSFECRLRVPAGRNADLTKLAHNLDAFQFWRIHKLEAVSAVPAAPA